MAETVEGWGVLRPGDRVFHYYRDGFSLCRKVGFYRDELTPDTGAPQSQDCATCARKLGQAKLVARRVRPGHYQMGEYTLWRQPASDYDRDLYWAVAKTADIKPGVTPGRIEPPVRLYFANSLANAKRWVQNQMQEG